MACILCGRAGCLSLPMGESRVALPPPSRARVYDSTPCTGRQHDYDRVSACIASSELCICPYGCSTEATGGKRRMRGGQCARTAHTTRGEATTSAAAREAAGSVEGEWERCARHGVGYAGHMCVDDGYGQWRGGQSGRRRRSRRWRRGARAPSQQRRAIRRAWQCGRWVGHERVRPRAADASPTSATGAVAATAAVSSGASQSAEAAGFCPPAQETGGGDE